MRWFTGFTRGSAAVATATLLTLVAGTVAQARDVAKVVSIGDPYASCADTGLALKGEANYPNAEVEPQVAVNPRNAGNMVAVWQQDRWSDGGARGLVSAATLDGGQSWRQAQLPFSRCAHNGVAIDRASDPWVSFGPDGTAYASALVFEYTNASNDNYETSGVAVATSTDGGFTWHNERTIFLDVNSPTFENDKPSITADPRTPGTAYVVWDRIDCPNCTYSFNGHVTTRGYLSKTTDSGNTWSTPRIFVPESYPATIVGNIIVVSPADGTLYDAFDLENAPKFSGFEEVTKSTDGGTTWTAPVKAGVDDDIGVTDPNTGQFVRSGAGLVSVALDTRHGGPDGTLYLTWESSKFSGGKYDEAAMTTSTDGGRTWAPQYRINDAYGGPAWTPIVAVKPDGTVGVTYYDFKGLPRGDTTTLPTHAWLITSPAGGRAFGEPEDVLGHTFNDLQAPNAGGFFVGDYQGLAVDRGAFVPIFGAVTDGSANPTDIYEGQRE